MKFLFGSENNSVNRDVETKVPQTVLPGSFQMPAERRNLLPRPSARLFQQPIILAAIFRAGTSAGGMIITLGM
jgi:hypothetical protein